MTTIALKETAKGWLPCHLSEIKKGDTFYVVANGKAGDISIATTDAQSDPQSESGWRVDSVRVGE